MLTIEDLKQQGLTGSTGSRIKVYYEQVVNDFNLMRLLIPSTVLYRIKNEGYLYWDDISSDVKYQIALYIFKKRSVIRLNSNSQEMIYFDKFNDPALINEPPKLVSDVSKDEMIKYFEIYNRTTEDVFANVNVDEYKVSISVPNNIFMDIEHPDHNRFILDYEQFALNTISTFLQTFKGQIAFMPFWGSNIKEYLHTLSPQGIADALRYELQNLLDNLRVKAQMQGVDFEVSKLKINVSESSTHAKVAVSVYLVINQHEYTYHIV